MFSIIPKHDPIIQEYIDKRPKQIATYLSPDIQNSTLKIIGKMIRDRTEVHLSGFFSLMDDETKDVSKQEQLSIVVRYVGREGIIN